jgi:hypothetical protein
MEPRAVRELASHLARGEKLIWAGTPAPLDYASFDLGWRLPVVAAVTFMIAISMLIVLSGEQGWGDAGVARIAVLMIGAPILAVCLAVLWSPVRRYLEAPRIVYGLTDRRAVFLVGGRNSRIEEVPASRFLAPKTMTNRSGTVDILFFEETRLAPGASPSFAGIGFRRQGFLGVRPPADLVARIAAMAAHADSRAQRVD